MKNRAKGGTNRAPRVRDWWVEGRRLYYRVEVDLSKAVGELDQVNPVWDLRLEIQRGQRDERLEVRDRPGRW